MHVPPQSCLSCWFISQIFSYKEYRPPFQAGQPDYPKSLISGIKALMDCSQDINDANPFFKLVACIRLVHGRGLPVEALKALDTPAPKTQAIFDAQGASPLGSHMETKLLGLGGVH